MQLSQLLSQLLMDKGIFLAVVIVHKNICHDSSHLCSSVSLQLWLCYFSHLQGKFFLQTLESELALWLALPIKHKRINIMEVCKSRLQEISEAFALVSLEHCHHHVKKSQPVFLRLRDHVETEAQPKPSPTARPSSKAILDHASHKGLQSITSAMSDHQQNEWDHQKNHPTEPSSNFRPTELSANKMVAILSH